MTRQNVLAVLLEDGLVSELRRAIAERAPARPSVHLVAPARVGALEWLATDEEAARTAAAVRVLDAEWSLSEQADVDGEPGEHDPVLAVEDALRRVSADEILLVGGAADDGGLQTSLSRFGLPVTRIPRAESVRSPNALREGVRALTSGRSRATPFVAFTAVNLALLALAAAISALVLLVLWLL
jgi:hypothetical protein